MPKKVVNPIKKKPVSHEVISNSPPEIPLEMTNSQPLTRKLISNILPLSNLLLPGEALLTLNAYFSGYRYIGSVKDSFGLSFIFSLIDYSFHFNQTEKLLLIQSLYTRYRHEMLFGDVQIQNGIINDLIQIIDSQTSASQKLDKLQSYIDYYDAEFIFLYRNCMNVIAKLYYHSKECAMIREVFDLGELRQIIGKEHAPFPTVLYLYFVEYFKVRICQLDSSTFEIEQMGSQLYPPLYILSISDNYYPLSTNFDLALRTLNEPFEYQGMIDFIVESEKLKNSNSKLSDLENNIKLEEAKFDESIEVFLGLVTNSGQYDFKKSQCLDGELNFEQSNIIASIVCDYCESICRNYKFECKHHFCARCYQSFNNANPLRCPKCGVECFRIDPA